MPEITTLLTEYEIGQLDIETIQMAAPHLEECKEELADYHYGLLMARPETARFLKDDAAMFRARTAFLDWFETILQADYNYSYYVKVHRAGALHVQIGLPTSHVNVAMLHIRNFLAKKISGSFGDDPDRALRVQTSLNKALDLNLDILTRSYREEEMKSTFLSYRLDSVVLGAAKWFVNGFNIMLVTGLIFIGLLVLGIAVIDFIHFFDSDEHERAALGALGSILMLWVIIELLDTQIRHMKGSAFAIKVFISVALVAELRHVLIISIESVGWQEEAILAGTILTLGAVYWLISKVEYMCER